METLLNPPLIIAVVTILFISALVRSTFGFGDALLSMPLLAFFMPLSTATPLVALVAMTIAMAILTKKWREVKWNSAWRLILFTWIGIPIGLLFLKGMHETVLKLILALLLVLFALFRLTHARGWEIKSERLAPIFGLIAGILGGAYNTNGPPVIIYGSLRKWTPESFRATLQGYFLPTGLAIVVGHAMTGLWERQVFQLYCMGIPFVLIAVWLGGRLHVRLSQRVFHRLVYLLLLCIGLGLGLRTVFPLLNH
jgi:uncharacterized membrane protein YfcA